MFLTSLENIMENIFTKVGTINEEVKNKKNRLSECFIEYFKYDLFVSP